jgi:pimeloyl-ACP methyl ester carboxylesterase
MEIHSFRYKSSEIHWTKAGTGRKLGVCFHGFMEDSAGFRALAEYLTDYTLVAFDLPFHGRTIWQEGLHLGIREWTNIIASCPEVGDRDYGIIGYSMGGKMALSVYESRPERVPFLWLIAPDGLKPDPWHHFATHTKIGHAIMRRTLKKPQGFFLLLDFLERTRLLNGSISKFVRYYMQDEAMREKVYQTWMTFREFRPDTRKITDLIERYKTDVSMVFGRYDRLCPAARGLAFSEGMSAVKMNILPAGHLLMREHHLPALAAALTGSKEPQAMAKA